MIGWGGDLRMTEHTSTSASAWRWRASLAKAGAAFCVAVLSLLAPTALAAGASDWPMEEFRPELDNKPSMQRGFNLYVAYCLGCHSMQYQRYERTADDLGIPHEIALDNLVFTGQRIGGLMVNAINPAEAKNWFGAKTPDLTMVTRVRSAEWVYNYLKTFYVDDTRPLGVNNKVFPNVGMPHALLELQGVQRAGVCQQEPIIADNGGEKRDPLTGEPITHEVCDNLVVDEGTGLMSVDEYEQAVADITNFMYYVGEPGRADRYRIGVFVLLFLVILYALAWLLNREYWKDIKH